MGGMQREIQEDTRHPPLASKHTLSIHACMLHPQTHIHNYFKHSKLCNTACAHKWENTALCSLILSDIQLITTHNSNTR